MTSIAPTQSNVLAALRSFLVAVLPDGVEVVQGQINRVAESDAPRFVVMSPPGFARLRTNVDAAADVRFAGSFADEVMTVTEVDFGTVLVGATVFGTGVAASTKVVAQLTGPAGGTGTYEVSVEQTLGETLLASGAKTIEQGAEVVVQLDFHSADSGTAGDLAMIVATALRDPYGVAQFAGQDPNYGVAPLFADDPRQMPFKNEADQVEWRWTLDAHLQANMVTSVPAQYADSVEVEIVSVDAAFPPA